jgi:hypothetical protein
VSEAPRPSDLGQMTPAQRKETVTKAREEKAAARRRALAEQVRAAQLAKTMSELIDNPTTPEERHHNRTLRAQQADRDLVLQCAEEGKFPVRLGNLFGPEGNVFNVIGAVRNGIRWAERQRVWVPDEAYRIVNGYMQRTYEDTLRLIETYALDLDGSIDAYWAGARGEAGAHSIRHGDSPLRGFIG